MGIKFERGNVGQVSVPDKHGAVECRIGDQNIKVHRDLADRVIKGDEILVVGELKKGILQAYAIKNINQNKTAKLDVTGYVLIMGVGFYLLIFFGVFGLEEIGGTQWESTQYILSIIGLIIAVWTLRRIIHIVKSDTWVRDQTYNQPSNAE